MNGDLRDAWISECGTYRYRLRRVWDNSKPLLGWVMLNPSTADADTDDPTIRRCKRFAADWGYGGIIVRNLFALRSTDPGGLDTHADPIGPLNDHELALSSAQDLTVLAWGRFAPRERARAVVRLLMLANGGCAGTGGLCVLGWTAGGQPRHPLYMPAATQPAYCDKASLTRLRSALVR